MKEKKITLIITEKVIVVQWIEEDSIYGKCMKVISSNHEIFKEGSRFDYGFFDIATEGGYTITSLPFEEQ